MDWQRPPPPFDRKGKKKFFYASPKCSNLQYYSNKYLFPLCIDQLRLYLCYVLLYYVSVAARLEWRFPAFQIVLEQGRHLYLKFQWRCIGHICPEWLISNSSTAAIAAWFAFISPPLPPHWWQTERCILRDVQTPVRIVWKVSKEQPLWSHLQLAAGVRATFAVANDAPRPFLVVLD